MPLNADDFDPLAKRDAPKSGGRDSATSAPSAPARGLDAASFNPLAPREPPKSSPASSGEWLQSIGLGAAALAGGRLAARATGLGARAGQAYEQAAKSASVGGKAISAPQTIFAPTSISPEARGAEALIREKTGEGARQTAMAQEPLKGQPKQASILNPSTWLQKTPWADIGGKPDPVKRSFISYVEGRSSGVKLADPSLQSLADKVRDAFAEPKRRSEELQLEGKDWAKFGFIQDYYAHMWEKNERHAELFSSPETFAAAHNQFTKQRRIPTIEDGIDMGLTPKSLDPVQTALEYVHNANRWITGVDILETAAQKKMVMRASNPSSVPPGWQQLHGSLAQRGLHKFYAPEGFAKVYNNFVSKGFQGEYKDAYNAARGVTNGITAFELGASGFHAGLMGFEGSVSEVARGIEHLFHGEFGKAANAIGRSSYAGVHLARTGAKVEQAWLGRTKATGQMREVVDLLTRAGGRGAGIEHTAGEYSFTAAGSVFDSIRRGSLRAEMQAARAEMGSQYGWGAVKTLARGVGRVMDSIAEPLFRSYVPKIKNGAFYETMSAWIERHPEADMTQKTAAAREIWDSIDNRFGQVVQDNIFWNKYLKQAAMLSMRSYSWNLGTVREIGGGAKDLFVNGKFTPRAYYLIALPMVYGAMSAIYQFTKTGTLPESEQDYFAPKTGGIDIATGQPERRNVYGYMKDIVGWLDDPVAEAGAKLGGGPHLAYQLATGKDSLGRPIHAPDAHGFKLMQAYMNHIAQAYVPITAKAVTGRRKGTNISTAERLGLGFQPAGQKWTAPERAKLLKLKRERDEWKRKERYERRQKSYLE
jgi:hypothetical protein